MNNRQNEFYKRAVEHALSKGGVCLSQTYKNSTTKLEWKCSHAEHASWFAVLPNVIGKNSWCPQCGFQKTASFNRTIDGLTKAMNLAESRGGICLSHSYNGVSENLLWKCKEKSHSAWTATYNNVVNHKQWCPLCYKENKREIRLLKIGLQKAIDKAKLQSGICLSTSYQGARVAMLWKCKEKSHPTWTATYNNVVNHGQWCPQCSKTLPSEKRARLIFEMFFGRPFPTKKPAWNKNPWTNSRLELDGYCEEFNIAFEFDGEHHFELTRDKKVKDLTYQKFKDEQKKKNCNANGITLINIKILDDLVERNVFELFLDNVINACKEKGLSMCFTEAQKQKLKNDFYSI